MQLTPVEFTGRALTIFENVLRTGLQAAGKALSRTQVPDVKALLGYLLDNLEVLFQTDTARREGRSYVHELREVRNKWAHSDPLNYEDAYRAADTAIRILKLLGFEKSTADAEALKREIRALQAQEDVYEKEVGAPRPAPGNFSTVAIIACGKSKQGRAASAIELYTGPIFQGSVEVAKSEGLPILILSTRYGLVDPNEVIEPYDLSYEAMTPSERERLVRLLQSQLTPFLQAGLRNALILGGAGYRALVGAALKDQPVKVDAHPRWKQVRKQVFG